jgi:putative membrane-bound dehydrogenase-like protein
MISMCRHAIRTTLFGLIVIGSLGGSVVHAQKKVERAPQVPAELDPHVVLLQPGVQLTLLAEHPDLVTPTGIDVDKEGNIWLIACHTHFRPDEYEGPEHDELLIFDRDGKKRRVFYNRTDATMQVKLGPDGWVYLAERDRILRVRDSDGDGVGDFEENVAMLDTIADYPHNGLSGMAWHPDGDLIFALGENFEKEWTLTGRDGSMARGRGEGGIFRCKVNGEKLRRIAQGFWNPFGLLVRDDGEMFAAENDPGSRPPCRLLNIVEGADYGFQRAYGNDSVHPFVAWNGELRGTLGMVHPSSEAPSAVVELGGGVMIPSWSSHCIDYYPLHRNGAGYTSNRIELVRGSDFFRPVGLAAGPNHSFFLTDWVFSSYQLHGRGRLWRLDIDPKQASWMKRDRDPINAEAQLAKDLRAGVKELPIDQLFELARGDDSYLSDAALTALSHRSKAWSIEQVKAMTDQDRVWAIVALRRIDLKETKWVRALIDDPHPEVQFECLRWIADGVLTEFLPSVEKMSARPDLDFRLFEAALAAWNTLRGEPTAGVTDVKVLIERITDPVSPARLKGFALRLAPAAHPKLTIPLLRELMNADDAMLAMEAVRTMAIRNTQECWEMLAEIASRDEKAVELRAESILGLASSTDSHHRLLLFKLAESKESTLRDEALRALRSATLDDAERQRLSNVGRQYPESADLVSAIVTPSSLTADRPPMNDVDGWLQRLNRVSGNPDAEAGRRIFFHPMIASCSNCHRYNGRGNVVGPELSMIAKQGDKRSILSSILEPDRELAPQFYTTLLELEDGNVFSGILLRSSSKDVFRDVAGKERTFSPSEIARRKELKTSMMPTGLATRLTDRELRDLLAFLTASR